MLKRIIVGAVIAGAAVVYGDNNIVKTLPVETAGGSTKFEMKFPGYVQVSNVQSQELSFTGKDGKKYTVAVRNNKALKRLNPGKYTINAVNVVVKKIGENNFYSMVGNYTSDEMATVTTNQRSGRYGMFLYNWKYLRKNILEPFTTLTLGSAHNPAIDEWRAEGRMVFCNARVTATGDDPNGFPVWLQRGGEKYIDGIGPDEFVVPAGRKDPNDAALGYNNPGRGFTPGHFQNIRNYFKKHPDKHFYAWVGIPWNGDCRAIKPLYEAVTSSPNSAILWESYLSATSRNDLHKRYNQRGELFKAASGNTLANYIMAPATYEYMDNDGAVDYKVLLDMQFHLVATDPLFDNVRGFGMWVAYYTEPEILRWYTKLVQHYGVDGSREKLSDKYGFKLYPGILKAHNWDNARDWNLSGGAELVAKKSVAAIKQGYLPYSTKNFLKLTINGAKAASASQTLQNLEPGKLYMVKTRFCLPDKTEKIDVNVNIALENAEIVEVEKRYLQDFTRRSLHVWNTRKVIFRAGKKPVKLIISGGTGNAPVTAIVDSVQAAPYFTE